jgi:hypothetical protein
MAPDDALSRSALAFFDAEGARIERVNRSRSSYAYLFLSWF